MLSVVITNVGMLSVTIDSVIKLWVIIPNAGMLSVVMLSVVAPITNYCDFKGFLK